MTQIKDRANQKGNQPKVGKTLVYNKTMLQKSSNTNYPVPSQFESTKARFYRLTVYTKSIFNL